MIASGAITPIYNQIQINEKMKNSVRLTGFLGSDPEILLYGNEKKLARVSLATHERYRDSDGTWKTDTQWHDLLYWGKQAIFAEKNLNKGLEISIEGRLMSRRYETKEGYNRLTNEVAVNETLILRPRLTAPQKALKEPDADEYKSDREDDHEEE